MLAALLPLAAAAAQAAPSVPGVPTAAVAAAHVEDCVAAAKPGRADLAVLERRGWRSAGVTVNKGKKAPFEIYFKAPDMTMLQAWVSGPEAGSCILRIPTPTVAEAEAVRAALGRKAVPAGGSAPGSEDIWTTAAHRLSLAPMGNAKASGLRVTVKPLAHK